MQLEIDGFVRWPSEKPLCPEFNLEMLRNQFSPFSGAHKFLRAETGDLLIDKYYGFVFDDLANLPIGLYGESDIMPTYAIDTISNFGFLRLPMRKVPRRIVRSRAELEEIINRIDTDTNVTKRFVFRGQHKEHCIVRTNGSRESLFGDPEAIEPSLLPSASRRARSVDNIISDWAHLVRFFMLQNEDRLRAWASEQTISKISESHQKLSTSPALLPFSTALAQHYGLPTFGLDVTTSLDVAVWFALNDFRSVSEGGFVLSHSENPEDLPVIYMLDVYPFQGYDFNNVKPKGWPVGRPENQKSWFMHTGWGFRLNRCATYIIAAFYLDLDGDFGPYPNASELFPLPGNDRFAGFLETLQNFATGELKEFITDFKWVV